MKLFECQFCEQPLYFENTYCESCGHELGFSPSLQNLSAVEWTGGAWTALADPSRSFRFCANAELRRLQLADPGRRSRTVLRRLPA